MRYVFDVDGTLCFDGITIDPALIHALKKLERDGDTIIFASARPIRDLLPVVKSFPKNDLRKWLDCF